MSKSENKQNSVMNMWLKEVTPAWRFPISEFAVPKYPDLSGSTTINTTFFMCENFWKKTVNIAWIKI